MALKLYDKLTPSDSFPLVDAKDVEMPDGSRLDAYTESMMDVAGQVVGQVGELSERVTALDKKLDEFSPGVDEETAERLDALEQQDQAFTQAATQLVGQVETISGKVSTLEETAETAMGSMLAMGLRLNALETPATSVDLTSFESSGVIVETHADRSTATYTMTFDDNGNPTKIVEVRKGADGQVVGEYETTLTW